MDLFATLGGAAVSARADDGGVIVDLYSPVGVLTVGPFLLRTVMGWR